MPRWVSFALVLLLPLFSTRCFGEQPAPGSTAAVSGLLGPVMSVFTEIFIYEDNGEKRPAGSERSIYDRSGYETERYEYDFRSLRSHTVYKRNDGHPVKTETTNPFSKEKSVQLYSSDGSVTEIDTYDANGVFIAKTVNDSSVKKATSTVSTTGADGGNTTIERFADGSFQERTVEPDGTTVVHAHYRVSPQPPLVLPVGDNTYGDWYQTSDANNRPLEFIEAPPGEYRRYLTCHDKAGREVETTTYDRSGQLLNETTFQYLQEDENGNWTEQQIWARTETGKARKLYQVTHRTITYHGNPHDRER